MRRGLASKLGDVLLLQWKRCERWGLNSASSFECRRIQRPNGFLLQRLCGRARNDASSRRPATGRHHI
jgi:hypothetical protein